MNNFSTKEENIKPIRNNFIDFTNFIILNE